MHAPIAGCAGKIALFTTHALVCTVYQRDRYAPQPNRKVGILTITHDRIMKKKWEDYRAPGYFDELITEQGNPRIAARKLVNHFSKLSDAEMSEFFAAAELAIREMGISFTVYSEGSNIDRS